MAFGIFMLIMGVLTAGGITIWAFWAAGKLGPAIWTSARSLPLLIAFWAGGTAMIIGGIYLMATDHPAPAHGAKHGRIPTPAAVRHG